MEINSNLFSNYTFKQGVQKRCVQRINRTGIFNRDVVDSYGK